MAIRVDSNAGSSQNALNPIAPKEVPTGAQVVKAKGGDTLWKMWSENKGGVSWEAFKAANAHIVKAANRDDGNLLAIGDAIVMPAKPEAAPPAPAAAANPPGWKADAARPSAIPPADVPPPPPTQTPAPSAEAVNDFAKSWGAKADALREEAKKIPDLTFAERPVAMDALMKKTVSFSNELQADAKAKFGAGAQSVLGGRPELALGALRNDLVKLGSEERFSLKDAVTSLKEAATPEAVSKTLSGWIDGVRKWQDEKYETSSGGVLGTLQNYGVGFAGGVAKGALGASKLLNAMPEFITETVPGVTGVLVDKVLDPSQSVIGDMGKGFAMEAEIVKGIAGRVKETYEKGGIGAVAGEAVALLSPSAAANAINKAERAFANRNVIDADSPLGRGPAVRDITPAPAPAPALAAPAPVPALAAPAPVPALAAPAPVPALAAPAPVPALAAPAPVPALAAPAPVPALAAPAPVPAPAAPAAAPAAPAAAATNFTAIKVGPGEHINNIAKRMLESAKNGQEVRASWGDQTLVANKNSTVAEILAQRSNPAVTKAPAPTH